MTIKEPHPVDIQVGLNIRAGRILRGISQKQLAQYCGITFQQIQKYEKGHTRVSASRLFEIAELFQVPEQWFFGESLYAQPQVDDKVLTFIPLFLNLDKKNKNIIIDLMKKI